MSVPLTVRLNEDIPEEKSLLERYTRLPRARRGEWLRQVLMAGVAALDGEDAAPSSTGGVAVAAALPVAPVVTRALKAAPASSPAPKAAPVPAAAAAGGVQKSSEHAVGAEDGTALRGFFDK